MLPTGIDPNSTEILPVAFHPVLWVAAAGVFAVIILQSVIYLRAIRRAGAAADLTDQQVSRAVRAGAVAAIGPSLAVALVAISLLPLFATPAVLTRIGLVGSAAFDVAAAGLAAGTQDAQLGGPTYTQKIFAIGFAAMTLGGIVWMLSALILTPILSKGDQTLRKVNPAVMTVVPAAALLGAFFTLALAETTKSPVHLVTLLVSAATMGLCLLGAKYLKKSWLHEWGLGFAIVVALAVAYFMTTG
ncbi:hypothetical protein D477_006376 [Arthrobacter crystallopoietes BAB-32]|uniref:Uncharacterized protein n=1 Tax=Arthrobacter crystallopoietes BAB-32 TaxID=1246476 RepID=N1V121_9MICC|nr:DUF5058 family protein [Arthrobacter crystallopoietes]EMY35035.1 hypothetical protein D477_006376 [Arthrobacter crystallopoietes BAB-32]